MRLSKALAVVSLALILASSFAQVASAVAFENTDDWTVVGTPTIQSVGFAQAAMVTFDNHLDISVLGVVILVLHNNVGQTVYYSAATVNITRGLYGTAYPVVAGVAPGHYNATIFAESTGGAAISNATYFEFAAA
ncbi:MAG TPA: hypothetical protein VLX56_08485 [Nitrososphaerales archaeon]|nr:hypothetical protein [Nitrososphaerales archaeon]